MTLRECVTETTSTFTPANAVSVNLRLEGVERPDFAEKIGQYLSALGIRARVEIDTRNTFPHGTGIASSASGLSAFALTLTDYLYHLEGKTADEEFFRRASSLARLASGSACRSVYGCFAVWGECKVPGASDEFAVPLTVHPELLQLCDSVLVISAQEKKVSSRSGHSRMHEHFFAQARYHQARTNFEALIPMLQSGDLEGIGAILEKEALTLHAMMLTSPEPYTLLAPGTLLCQQALYDFRAATGIPVFFTLDAGPNLHLIYPASAKPKVQTFIQTELAGFCEHVIHDEVGAGPERC